MIAAKIMVVEDEEPLGVLLKYNLEAEGYQAEIITRGDEAEMRLQENVPDLLVLDWMVPAVSGIELCRRLRMRPETERLPIIMDALVTAYDIVVVECGPADVASVQRLIGEGAEIMVSVLEPHDRAVAESAAELEAAGFRGFSLVTPEGHESPPQVSGRSAA